MFTRTTHIASFLLIVFFFLSNQTKIRGQSFTLYDQYMNNLAMIDSLEDQSNKLLEKMNANQSDILNWYRLKAKLDMTSFEIQYEKYILEQNLEAAEKLVQSKLHKAISEERSELVSVFSTYKKDLQQTQMQLKVKYSKLLKNKYHFKKNIKPFYDANNTDALEQARYVSSMARRIAIKQHDSKAAEIALAQEKKAEALIYDLHSEYDLEKLTRVKKEFEKVYNPLVNSNDVDYLNVANEIVQDCQYYATRLETRLDSVYFERKKNLVNSRLLKIEHENLGTDKGNIAQRIELKMDSINENGIYRFYDKIVVIGSFNPSEDSRYYINRTNKKLMKGAAIAEADRLLARYVRSNLKGIRPSMKIKHAYLIPYQKNGKYNWLYPDRNGNMQYRVAYSFVDDKKTTELLLNEFLKPVSFTKD